MWKKNLFYSILVLAAIAIITGFTYNQNTSMQNKSTEPLVVIHTEMGDITLKLYNETPQHRDNFLKLIREGWYTGSVFHRVIKDFMIQGGWNSSGVVDPGYTIPAEFNKAFIHKKGALAAARMGDPVNPEKRSSGCQFYIVQGRKFDSNQVSSMGRQNGISYTPDQLKTYETLGGTPHLDGAYTVFGEVVSGLEVVDKIGATVTGPGDKPVKDIKMTIEILD